MNPVTKNEICPATVIDVVDDKYFIVEIDDVRPLNERSYIRFGCHIDSPGIFPAMWCRRKGIHLKKPAGLKIYKLSRTFSNICHSCMAVW